MRRLRIKSTTENPPKLALVKAVKFLTSLGLKEAKEQCDPYFYKHKDYVEVETHLNKIELDEQLDYLKEHGYSVVFADHIDRDINIAEVLALFKVEFEDRKIIVTEGSYNINDLTGQVDMKIKEGTEVRDFETKEVKNQHYILHISKVFIQTELE